MKKLASHISLWTAIATLLAGAIMPTAVLAAAAPAPNPNSGQALEIAPPVITLTANPGQTAKTQVYLRNISSGNLVVTGEANDFVASGEDGTPKLLLKDEGSNPYSLKNWIAPVPSMIMTPKEIKPLLISINVPANASPGGHYGVIRFTGTPASLQTTGVSLSASLGALILLTVNGKITESLSVQEFSVNHGGKSGSLFESGPLNFVERLKNSGNVHVAPAGQVTITDMFGKKVAALNINQPPHNILPQSIRKFSEPLDSTVIGNKKLFGRYHASLSLTYGTSKKTLTGGTTFWVIPYRLIGLLIVVLVGGFFLLRYLIRRYNQRVIERSRNNPPGNNPPGPGNSL